jgi:hypothetical protein
MNDKNEKEINEAMIEKLNKMKLANLYLIDKHQKEICMFDAKIERLKSLIEANKKFYVISPDHEVCERFSTRENAQYYIDNPIFDETRLGFYIIHDEDI